jgi:hypothetical protein
MVTETSQRNIWRMVNYIGVVSFQTPSPFFNERYSDYSHDNVQVTQYPKPVLLLSAGQVPGERVADFIVKLERFEDTLYGVLKLPKNSDLPSVLEVDSGLYIQKFIGEDDPTHASVVRAYFSNGKLRAVRGWNNEQGKGRRSFTNHSIDKLLSKARSDANKVLLDLFKEELHDYFVREVEASGQGEYSFKKFQDLFKDESLQEPMRRLVSSVL